ncbi:hypothetical protein CCR95_17515 [Thiocystis minor]|nr:hypothetical protein [Thiocystis minor]
MGVPVVSEISKDLCQYQGLENLVIFTEIGNVDCMILEIEKLLKSKCLREERKSAISDFVQEDNVFAQHLKRYFLSVGVLSLDNYLRELKITPEISCDIPKLCLTLPETPIRTRSFINQGKIDFKFVEGMRHAIGWVGCGLSYKCIAHELVLKASELAVICEDDVFFPPDFDQRLNHAIAYLKHDFFSWHIFVGMVAHLHPSTNILRIHEFKGIEYIYIDTMTSMVMNIYSPAGLDLIRQWNEKNEDPYTNTIDRYLERISGLVVVVTLPFLVGHSEEQESTLWGIANVQYRELIDQSEKLLADKVADYKSRSRYLTEVSAL